MQLFSSYPSAALPPVYTIVPAQPEHLSIVAEIENRAGDLFLGSDYVSMAEGVSDETVPVSEFVAALLGGHWWVALADEVPVGFALVKMLTPEHPHLEEIDVLPEHGRRGLGTALLRTVQSWVARAGYREITLTTFCDVPWNRPFYERRGFEVIPPSELGEELLAVVAKEARRGLRPEQRVAMRYRLRSPIN